MPSRSLIGLSLFLLLLFGAALPAEPPAAESVRETAAESTTSKKTLELRVEPLADFWFYLRSQEEAGDKATDREFPELIAAVAHMREALRSEDVSWAAFDSELRFASTIPELRENLEHSWSFGPEKGAPEVRAAAKKVLDGLEASFPRFLEALWPKHEQALLAARDRIEKQFRPVESRAFDFMLESLDMTDPEITIPVYLVARSPWPEAVTYRTRGGGGVVFIGTYRKDHQGTLLYEILLHEATHALDMAARETPHALMRLRQLLRDRGIEIRDLLRTVPHNLMFIQAGETIRRVLDENHVDYGVVSGYYDRAAHAPEEREIWHGYLAGETTLDAALGRISKLPPEPVD